MIKLFRNKLIRNECSIINIMTDINGNWIDYLALADNINCSRSMIVLSQPTNEQITTCFN